MSQIVDKFFGWVDKVVERSSRIVCYLVFVIMVITAADVTARYVFNHPLVWGWLTNRLLFGVFILFAGVYTLYKGEHIRIEIFYDHFPPKIKSIARWIALVAFVRLHGRSGMAIILDGLEFPDDERKSGRSLSDSPVSV